LGREVWEKSYLIWQGNLNLPISQKRNGGFWNLIMGIFLDGGVGKKVFLIRFGRLKEGRAPLRIF